ncbi:hypothetical protein VNO77_03836 [Canavalia gladiata]|uniref:Uncharacterized protein n=1 Tax=Canavalia gladiata TaxID=3824 RepID=A0AAN9MVJ9_CANGL
MAKEGVKWIRSITRGRHIQNIKETQDLLLSQPRERLSKGIRGNFFGDIQNGKGSTNYPPPITWYSTMVESHTSQAQKHAVVAFILCIPENIEGSLAHISQLLSEGNLVLQCLRHQRRRCRFAYTIAFMSIQSICESGIGTPLIVKTTARVSAG